MCCSSSEARRWPALRSTTLHCHQATHIPESHAHSRRTQLCCPSQSCLLNIRQTPSPCSADTYMHARVPNMHAVRQPQAIAGTLPTHTCLPMPPGSQARAFRCPCMQHACMEMDRTQVGGLDVGGLNSNHSSVHKRGSSPPSAGAQQVIHYQQQERCTPCRGPPATRYMLVHARTASTATWSSAELHCGAPIRVGLNVVIGSIAHKNKTKA